MTTVQRLLPLAPEMGAPPTCQRALSAIYAEDGLDETQLAGLVDESRVIFPGIEELTLYFRSRTGQTRESVETVRSIMLQAEWKGKVANAGYLDAGDHGMMAFVILHLPSA